MSESPAGKLAGDFLIYGMSKYKKPITTLVALLAIGTLWWFLQPSYEHPAEFELADFVYIEQPDSITCGPTSATMVLNYYGHDVSVSDVKEATKTEWFKYHGQEVGMTAPEYIAPAMSDMGVDSFQKVGNLQELKHYVSQGRPTVVLLRSGQNLWHYVVVIGYTPFTVVVADPGWGKRVEMPVENFVDSWSYKTDMRGNSSKKKCSTCDGTGRWASVPGPLGRCVVCDGTGESDDVLSFLLGTVDAKPYTMIVPREKRE